MNDEFLGHLQRRLAGTAIGPSTARGMGPTGTIKSARRYLADLDLRRFEVRSRACFVAVLDAVTEELRDALPADARNWGSARKFLNIFLRGCVYNRHLCARFKIERLEPWLEIPLDSHAALGLRDAEAGLPRWRTVVGLTRDVSDAYQAAATRIARRYGVCRVHLDLLYWRSQATAVMPDK